jgi:valyl-tRNA synthetase
MLEKTYQPADIEARIHATWMETNAFKAGRPERAQASPYCIVIPPPNVTGSLHMGHALNNTLQDVLCRFERMCGRDVLWQPGTDHAGIATQLVVERQMMERQEPDRRTIGREKFLEKVWAWKAESGGTIVNQLQRLGASCDWSRERFTMDEGLSKAVLKVFVDLYNKGLIYKDKRLVNWDPEFRSALSDLEVESIEARGSFNWTSGDPDKPFDAKALNKVLDRNPSGHLYHFRYPLKDDPTRFIVVATTRPETMLGDTAVAVHPEDERYKALVGKTVVLPLVGREIPIIADDYSDPEKGSGAVKITPAHDFNDYAVGKRHNLPLINILDASAQLNDNVPEKYRGLDRFAARKQVVADLVALGLVEKIEAHAHAVPHAQRGNAVIEPWLTDQWYVNAAELAKPAIAAVETGRTRFVPQNWEKTYFEWMRNIQPWCISRQLWWGHQIPAWYGPDGKVFVAESEAAAYAQARKYYAPASIPSPRPRGEGKGEGQPHTAAPASAPHPDPLPASTGRGGEIVLTRDEDVLDTWFSSALWPFSTLGWPEETKELKRFYPTSVLVTGFDIIFFWVARMMMMGLHFMKEVPFHDVYIHALVRDEKGAKMSKTKGNVMDPLEIIDRYGADALRFTLAAMAAQGRDIKLSTNRVEGYRNFATKLWNAARFAEMNGCARSESFDPKRLDEIVNRWIAGELERAVAAVTAGIQAYKFNEAAGAAYEFVWGTFCDWYLEFIKPVFEHGSDAAKAETRATTAWVLDQVLKLLHPFMPFITEELWARTAEVGGSRESMLCLSDWPVLEGLADAEADEEMGWVVKIISEVRSVRSEMNVPAGAKIALVLVGASKVTRERVERHDGIIKRLARLEETSFSKTAPKGSAQIVVGEATVALPLAGVIDMAAERARLTREIEKSQAEIRKVDAKLANESFMAKAPPEVVEENRDRKTDFEATVKKLQAALKRVEAAA